MLAKVDMLMSDSRFPSRGRSRGPSPPRGRSPSRREERDPVLDSEWSQVVGRKGKNKGKGKRKSQGPAKLDADSSEPRQSREVKFADADLGVTCWLGSRR